MTRRASIAVALVVGMGLVMGTAAAHGLRPGVLTLVETQPGVFTMQWTAPIDTRSAAPDVQVVLPTACTRTDTQVSCGETGLHGTLEFAGLAEAGGRVLVSIEHADGRVTETLVGADDPTLVLDAGPGRSATAWISLGVRHILGGVDHLAFVAGLLLVVGAQRVRRLVATITAFTVAHSLTLALAATGVLTLASAPVEATIAASVVLVAREGLHDRPTLTRRAPWVVALVFGLVHGLGFAGALREWGLPAGWVGRSLLWFNVGVELGQLAVVVLAIGAARLLGVRAGRVRPIAAYAIGALGAWWLVERTLVVVTAGS